MQQIRMLARYKAWADDLFMVTVGALPAEELVAPRAIVFGSLIRTLHHVWAMDHVWRCHLLGTPHGVTSRNPEYCPDIGELAEAQRQMDAWYVAYAYGLTEEDLRQVVDFAFIGGGRGGMTRGDILLHVVNHTTYHHGHVADMLYTLQVTPPTTDLPVFLRGEQATGANA